MPDLDNVERPSPGLVIAGLDIGFGRPGLSIVKFNHGLDLVNSVILFSGFLETTKGDGTVSLDDVRRVTESTLWIRNKLLEFRPSIIVVELPMSGAKSAMALKSMAMATGYTASLLAVLKHELEIDVIFYSPYETKKVCTGDSKADKEEMISAAMTAWPNVRWPTLKTKPGFHHPERTESMADSLCAILTYVLKNPT